MTDPKIVPDAPVILARASETSGVTAAEIVVDGEKIDVPWEVPVFRPKLHQVFAQATALHCGRRSTLGSNGGPGSRVARSGYISAKKDTAV